MTGSVATPSAHRDTGEGFGGKVARLCSWAARERGPGGGRTAGARRGWNLDYRSPTLASARAGQGRERSGQTWQSAFSTRISERKEGIQDRQEGLGKWRWFQMRTVQQSRREWVFRRGSRKRSPMAEAEIWLVRG